jgi:hypothetical protein
MGSSNFVAGMNMRSKMAGTSLLLAGVVIWLNAGPAQAEDDLILPPDLRAPGHDLDPSPASKQKSVKAPASKNANNSKSASKKKPAPSDVAEPAAAASKTAMPAAKPDEDPLSFGMQWNATDHTNGGPGSLSEELNKNINGAAVGTGAEVGVKYKF